MYYLLGACIALAALLKFNALASLLSSAVWLTISRSTQQRWSASKRAALLFALRVFPAVSALFIVVIFFIPAYVAHEPYPSPELVGGKLAILAAVSATGIALTVLRGVASWRATRRLLDDWLRHAEPIKIEGVSIPTYRFQHSFPVIAVVGAFRPQLFIANQIFDSLTDEELAVAISHEKGHLVARDTFKRAFVHVCRDVLSFMPTGHALNRAWAEESERAADERAARLGAPAALDLAATLIKIVRMAPTDAKLTMPAGSYLISGTDGDVTDRVRRLTEIATNASANKQPSHTGMGHPMWVVLGGFFFAVSLIATYENVLLTAHAAIEHAVHLLN